MATHLPCIRWEAAAEAGDFVPMAAWMAGEGLGASQMQRCPCPHAGRQLQGNWAEEASAMAAVPLPGGVATAMQL